jgi:ATP-binding cassette, subfamily B, multidrug efflux pump
VVKGDTWHILRVGGVMLAAALLQALCAVAAVRYAARTAMALGQDVPLSAILLVVIPVLGVLAGLILSRMRPLVRSMQERIDALNRILREQIAGVRVIRAFAKDDHERQRFSDANAGLAAVALPVGRLSLLMLPLGSVMVNTLGVPVVWFGAHRIADGSMRVGALAAFLLYLALILNSVTTATFLFMMLPRAEVCAERIGEVLSTGAQEAVLRGVDFTAEPGEVVAVIGSTGSGKSSLLELVPRLADASRGQVLVGGVDVRALEPALLARIVGLVPQKPYLFSGTVASNLRFGRPDASDEELWQALEVSQARRFVEQLPDGLEAPVAQGGSNSRRPARIGHDGSAADVAASCSSMVLPSGSLRNAWRAASTGIGSLTAVPAPRSSATEASRSSTSSAKCWPCAEGTSPTMRWSCSPPASSQAPPPRFAGRSVRTVSPSRSV